MHGVDKNGGWMILMIFRAMELEYLVVGNGDDQRW